MKRAAPLPAARSADFVEMLVHDPNATSPPHRFGDAFEWNRDARPTHREYGLERWFRRARVVEIDLATHRAAGVRDLGARRP